MVRNTILAVFALTVLILLGVFVVVDYLYAASDRVTFSAWCGAVYQKQAGNPQFWLILGVCVGFAIGLILGFILGHLFWPITGRPAN